MKKFFFNTLTVLLVVFSSMSLKAQPVVTEYIVMKEPFKIDLTDKKVQKAALIKGVLDLDWNESKRILTVNYDPKLTNVQDIVNHVKEVSNSVISASNTAGGAAKNEK